MPVLGTLEATPTADDDRRFTNIEFRARSSFDFAHFDAAFRDAVCRQLLHSARSIAFLRPEDVGADADNARCTLNHNLRSHTAGIHRPGNNDITAFDVEPGGIGG